MKAALGGLEHPVQEAHVTHLYAKGMEVNAPEGLSDTKPLEDPATFTGKELEFGKPWRNGHPLLP